MRTLILSLVALTAACATSAPAGPAPTALGGTSWSLSYLPNMTLAPTARPQTLTFANDGHISGGGGCNGFGGDYTQSGASLQFAHIIHTMMACTPGMESEQAYLNALENTRGASLELDTLTLNDGHGKTLARLTRREPEGS